MDLNSYFLTNILINKCIYTSTICFAKGINNLAIPSYWRNRHRDIVIDPLISEGIRIYVVWFLVDLRNLYSHKPCIFVDKNRQQLISLTATFVW
jgi:hypothetical protein